MTESRLRASSQGILVISFGFVLYTLLLFLFSDIEMVRLESVVFQHGQWYRSCNFVNSLLSNALSRLSGTVSNADAEFFASVTRSGA